MGHKLKISNDPTQALLEPSKYSRSLERLSDSHKTPSPEDSHKQYSSLHRQESKHHYEHKESHPPTQRYERRKAREPPDQQKSSMSYRLHNNRKSSDHGRKKEEIKKKQVEEIVLNIGITIEVDGEDEVLFKPKDVSVHKSETHRSLITRLINRSDF